MARSTAARLAAHQRRYRQLAGQLADIGLITAGSITRRYTRCGTAHCRCHAEPPQPHGPYHQWTAKANGKTITRRLTEPEARLYQEWRASEIPDTGSNRVRPGMEDGECQNGAGSLRMSSKMRP